ncbi:MAG: Histidinol-phosphate aminotransferase [Actinobacteria bacterium ADurb.Bin346]|nr:MAG: Histidinol-phosphate aminotransferase [Actinobacteria bacterium ADurb.Bin346]
MKPQIKKWLNELPEYVAGRTIEEIKAAYNISNVYKLASNENLFGPCEAVKKILSENIGTVNYYPDSDAREVRQKIADHYKIRPENIIMGNGTDQIIEMICDCFIDEGDNVVTADPNFLIYEKSARKCGGTIVKVPLQDFKQDIKGIMKKVNENTKIVFIASPHNPSGTIITKNEFEYLLDKVKQDVLVVMDEAYCEYLDDAEKFDTISYVSERPNLAVLRTFSKIYGLAGLRIGYGISSADIIADLNRIRMPFNISSLAQKAACAAIDDCEYILKIRDTVKAEREKFAEALKKEGIGFIKSCANFMLISTEGKTREIVEELLKKGFIVRPGENLGMPGYIRVSFATPEIDDLFLKNLIKIYRTFVKK